jgi:hypothetical protein
MGHTPVALVAHVAGVHYIQSLREQFGQVPNVIGDTRLHRRRHS